VLARFQLTVSEGINMLASSMGLHLKNKVFYFLVKNGFTPS